MLRTILGVIVGYIVMGVIVMVGLTALYLALGVDFAFREASYEPSIMWILCMFVIGVVAAVVGGMVCRMIGRSETSTAALVAVVLLLGGLSAVLTMSSEAPTEPRSEEFSSMEAMQQAQTPAWVLIANPIVGVFGVVLGGAMVSKKGAPVVVTEAGSGMPE